MQMHGNPIASYVSLLAVAYAQSSTYSITATKISLGLSVCVCVLCVKEPAYRISPDRKFDSKHKCIHSVMTCCTNNQTELILLTD